jgi:hypothetical protein
MKNVAFVLFVGAWALTHGVNARAIDRGCIGEDSYGESPAGNVFCSGVDDCCGSAWATDGYDTVNAFCEDYGGPDMENSYYEGGPSGSQCSSFVIHCVCIPLPR